MALKNKMLLFSPHVLQEVDRIILQGGGLKMVQKVLAERYKGDLPIPGTISINNYIRMVKNKSQQLDVLNQRSATLVANSDKALEGIQVDSVIFRNKHDMLWGLVDKCRERMSLLEQAQQIHSGMGVEAIIQKYITEQRNILETLAKLKGEISEDRTIVISIVKDELQVMFQIVVKLISELAPNIKDVFVQRFKQEIANRRESVNNDMKEVREADVV